SKKIIERGKLGKRFFEVFCVDMIFLYKSGDFSTCPRTFLNPTIDT
ncbi:hypothetical protein CP8484711_2193, partial [Chlamydia psittaci 84-8471/1]